MSKCIFKSRFITHTKYYNKNILFTKVNLCLRDGPSNASWWGFLSIRVFVSRQIEMMLRLLCRWCIIPLICCIFFMSLFVNVSISTKFCGVVPILRCLNAAITVLMLCPSWVTSWKEFIQCCVPTFFYLFFIFLCLSQVLKKTHINVVQ